MPDQDAYTGDTILDPKGANKGGQPGAQPPQAPVTGPTTRLEEAALPQSGAQPVSKQVPLPPPFRPPAQPAGPTHARPATSRTPQRRPFLPLFGSWLWTMALLAILIWIVAIGRIMQIRSRNAQVQRPTVQIVWATPTQAVLPTSTFIPTATPAPADTAAAVAPTVTLIPGDAVKETTTIHGVDPSYRDRGNYFYADKGVFGAYLFSDTDMKYVIGAPKGYVLLSNGDEIDILDAVAPPGWVKIVVKSNVLDHNDQRVLGAVGWVPAWIITGTNVPTPVAQAKTELTSGIYDNPDDGTHGGCVDGFNSSIWGVVVDQDGLAWPGESVHIVSKGGYDIEVFADDNGRFNTGHTLACGEWMIVVRGGKKIGYTHVSGGYYDGYGARVVVRY